MQQKVTIRTRPFQPFFLAADDLLGLAKPYYDQIDTKKTLEQTGRIEFLPEGVWRKEKSLSISSFMIKYAGLEAFVNCTYDEFQTRDLDSLPDEYFVGKLQGVRNKLMKNSFPNWYLPSRAFLVIPLCSNAEIDPRNAFDTTSEEWEKFEEIVKIRHSFSHAASVNSVLVVTKAGPRLGTANDENPDNFWPVTGARRDHRLLNYETARALNSVIDWVVGRLRKALPEQLNDSYMTQEQAKVSNKNTPSRDRT